jgi:hypothetical protein
MAPVLPLKSAFFTKEKTMTEKDRVENDREVVKERDNNPDPITGAPGSHPVGTGVGAAGGGAAATWAGAAIGGAAGGPIGAVVGGVVGAVAGAVGGGAVGKSVAENIDPTVEGDYWSKEYTARPYYENGMTYENDYAPAYRHGWESRSRYTGRKFDEVETDLKSDWEKTKAKSRLSWDKAKAAVRDAWDRVDRKVDRAAYPNDNRTASGMDSDRDRV